MRQDPGDVGPVGQGQSLDLALSARGNIGREFYAGE